MHLRRYLKMFSKLLKNDLSQMGSRIYPLYFIILGLAVFAKVMNVLSSHISAFQIIYGFTIMAWVCSIIIGLVYTFFVAIQIFYKKNLKDEGYLTHTLPVTKTSIVSSMFITAMIFTAISILISILSIMIAFYTPGIFNDFYNSIQVAWNSLDSYIQHFAIFSIIIMILSYMQLLSGIYCALSVGHSFSGNKLAYSVVAWVIIYIISQVLNTIAIFVLMWLQPENIQEAYREEVGTNFMYGILTTSMITNSIMLVGTYITTIMMLKHRLNLE